MIFFSEDTEGQRKLNETKLEEENKWERKKKMLGNAVKKLWSVIRRVSTNGSKYVEVWRTEDERMMDAVGRKVKRNELIKNEILRKYEAVRVWVWVWEYERWGTSSWNYKHITRKKRKKKTVSKTIEGKLDIMRNGEWKRATILWLWRSKSDKYVQKSLRKGTRW